jgi:glucose-1-phosphate adenylyltransferase
VAAIPVHRREAGGLGILQVDETGRITRFVEKPTEASVLDELIVPPNLTSALGLASGDNYGSGRRKSNRW